MIEKFIHLLNNTYLNRLKKIGLKVTNNSKAMEFELLDESQDTETSPD